MASKEVLSFFILRSQSLALYRSFLRELRTLPEHIKGDTHAEIRRRFEANRGVRDLYAVKFNLSDGRASLKALREMKGMTTRA